jgi:hypothetical protein
MGGNDTCIGGAGNNTATNCETVHSAAAQRGPAHSRTTRRSHFALGDAAAVGSPAQR